MEITIKGKKLDLNFGVQFVRELDQIAGMELNLQGQVQKFGMGMVKSIPALQGYDTAVLSDILYCACWDNKNRPSRRDMDAFIDDPKTDLEEIFDGVKKSMSEANAVKLAAKNLRA